MKNIFYLVFVLDFIRINKVIWHTSASGKVRILLINLFRKYPEHLEEIGEYIQ